MTLANLTVGSHELVGAGASTRVPQPCPWHLPTGSLLQWTLETMCSKVTSGVSHGPPLPHDASVHNRL